MAGVSFLLPLFQSIASPARAAPKERQIHLDDKEDAALLQAPRRFVWNPTFTIGGRSRARWACGQAAFGPVHMPTGR